MDGPCNQNAINFPAAILQPPFFDPLASTAANFGAIGSIIGHEISHTFDTEGNAFDSKGRVRNWWTPTDTAHFKAAAALLVAEYNAYKPFPDLSVSGEQTLAENIADVAGVAAAYDGCHASLAGETPPGRDGFPATSSSLLPLGRTAQPRCGRLRFVSLWRRIRILLRSSAPTQCVMSMPGTRLST
jgi:putative endopeptidase